MGGEGDLRRKGWKAVISNQSTDVRSRFNFSGPLYNVAGEVVATSMSALWSGQLSAPVKYDILVILSMPNALRYGLVRVLQD